MTLELLRNEIWAQIGEPTDLDPSSDEQYSGGPLLTWVANEGQRQVAMWKDQRGQLRIRSLIAEAFFQWKTIEGTLEDDAPADNQIILPAADVGAHDDRYNGWIVTVGGETKLVTDYVGGTLTATIHEDWDTSPEVDDEYTLYKRFALMVPPTDDWATESISLPVSSTAARAEGNLVEVLKIEDLLAQSTLKRGRHGETYIGSIYDTGVPGEWVRYGNRILFDRALEDERWFRMEYYRLPTDMAADSDEAEIPGMFHYGIVLWGIEWGMRRSGQSGAKYSTKRDFEDFMRRTKSQYDVSYERSDDYGTLERG